VGAQHRPARVGQLIQELLGRIFTRGLRDPRIGMVTVTGVDVTADLREATVFWTAHGSEEELAQTGRGLEAARGFLRREVGKDLSLRVTPELRFEYDVAIDRGERIERLLKEVKEEDAAREKDGEP